MIPVYYTFVRVVWNFLLVLFQFEPLVAAIVSLTHASHIMVHYHYCGPADIFRQIIKYVCNGTYAY